MGRRHGFSIGPGAPIGLPTANRNRSGRRGPAVLLAGSVAGTLEVGRTLRHTPTIWHGAERTESRWRLDGLEMGDTTRPLPLHLLHAFGSISVRERAWSATGEVSERVILLPGTVTQPTGLQPELVEGLEAGIPAETITSASGPAPVAGRSRYSPTTGLRRMAGGGLTNVSGTYMAEGNACLLPSTGNIHVFAFDGLSNLLLGEVGFCSADASGLYTLGASTGYAIRFLRIGWGPTNPIQVFACRFDGGGAPEAAPALIGTIHASSTTLTVSIDASGVAVLVTIVQNGGANIPHSFAGAYRGPSVRIKLVAAGTGLPTARITLQAGIRPVTAVPIEDRYQSVFAEEWDDPLAGRITEQGLPVPGRIAWGDEPAWGDVVINGEFQRYGGRLYSVSDSVLTLRYERLTEAQAGTIIPIADWPEWNRSSGQFFLSDHLNTFRSWSAQYVTVVARIKSSAGSSIWPAGPWLMPVTDTWDAEIDPYEADGGRPTAISHARHEGDPTTGQTHGVGDFVPLPHGWRTDEWNEVMTVWGPLGPLDNFVNGVFQSSLPHSIHRQMYLLCNLAVGSTKPDWIPEPDETTPDSGEFQIDYIRCYQRPSHLVGLPVITRQPEVIRVGDTVTIKHGISDAASVYSYLRTGNTGVYRIPGTERTRASGAAVADTTFDLSESVPEGKFSLYEVHTSASGKVIQTAATWIWFGHESLEEPPPDEIEITGVTAQAPGNSYMPDGYVGPWAYLRNVFKPGGLVDGEGYTIQQWRSASSTWPEKFRFAWEFPNSNPAPTEFCWGYPALIWGAGPWGYAWGTSGHGAPMRASEISAFTIDVDLSFSGANGADVLVDAYVLKGTTAPVFNGDYHNEVSILLSHNGVGPIDWMTTEATATHTFPAPLGDCAIYKQPTSRQIMVMPRTGTLRRDVMAGEIPVGAVIAHLIAIGLVEPDGWIAGFEIGVETQRPNAWNSAPFTGDLRFNEAPVVTFSSIVPGHTVRTNRRWINPTSGSDLTDGLTKETAWKTMARTYGSPADTEFIIVDGVHNLTGSFYRRGPHLLPQHSTVRAETPRGATLVGPLSYPASGAIYPESNLFVMTTDDADPVDIADDWEIYGLVLECDARQGAPVLIQYNNRGFRVVNNLLRPRYPDWHTHGIYLSSGTTAATAPRQFYVGHNDIEMRTAQGSGIHSFAGEFGPAGSVSGCHDGIVEHNRITGIGRWGMIWEPTRNGVPLNIQCRDNTVDGSWIFGAVVFGPNHLIGADGVDPTFVLSGNRLRNDHGWLVRRYEVEDGDDQHAPTLGPNAYSAADLDGAVAGRLTDGVRPGDSLWNPPATEPTGMSLLFSSEYAAQPPGLDVAHNMVRLHSFNPIPYWWPSVNNAMPAADYARCAASIPLLVAEEGYRYGGLCDHWVMDWETFWPQHGQADSENGYAPIDPSAPPFPTTAGHITKFAQSAAAMRAALHSAGRSNIKIGFYGILPIDAWSTTLSTPGSVTFNRQAAAMEIPEYAALLEQVDYLTSTAYLLSTFDEDHLRHLEWQWRTAKRIAPTKPLYVYICPQFTGGPDAWDYMSPETFGVLLDLIREHADGAIWWGSQALPKAVPHDNDDPRWLQFLASGGT